MADYPSETAMSPPPVEPYPEVLVHHKVRHFGRSLRLRPGQRARPSPDFLVKILTGTEGHQAWLRQLAGAEYDNVENVLHGHHRARPKTMGDIDRALPGFTEMLAWFGPGAPTGDLWPGLLRIIQVLEGAVAQSAISIDRLAVPCPCCAGNLFGVPQVWWTAALSRRGLQIGPAEAMFAERALKATVGTFVYIEFFECIQGRTNISLRDLMSLAAPGRNAVGNWLRQVGQAHGVQSMEDLAAKVPGVMAATLHRWSSWSGPLAPSVKAERLSQGLGRDGRYHLRFMGAMAITLVTEFLVACHEESIAPKVAQEVVHARLQHLCAGVAAMRSGAG